MHVFFDLFDLLSQHKELCFAQAVHYRVEAVDEVVQIINISKSKVETGQFRNQSAVLYKLCIQSQVSIITC